MHATRRMCKNFSPPWVEFSSTPANGNPRIGCRALHLACQPDIAFSRPAISSQPARENPDESNDSPPSRTHPARLIGSVQGPGSGWARVVTDWLTGCETVYRHTQCMNHGLVESYHHDVYVHCTYCRVCVHVCIERKRGRLRQSAMVPRGAANHHQPVLPQLLHSMRREISDDMGGRRPCCQHSAALARLFQPTSEPARAWQATSPSQQCSIPRCQSTDSSSSTWTRRAMSQATASFGNEDQQISSEQVHLHCRTQAFLVPPVGALRRIRATSPLPCPASPLARPPPCAVAALKPGGSRCKIWRQKRHRHQWVKDLGTRTRNPNPGTKIVSNDPLDWFLAAGASGASATNGSSTLAARLVHGAPVSCCWCDASAPISFSGIP